MSITVFADVTMPPNVLAAGVRGKQMRRNNRVTTVSGAESINIDWTQTLRQYEVGFVPMRRANWQAITTLHEVTEGGAYGFLMFDPVDQTVASTEGVAYDLGAANEYQLYKRYEHAVSSRFTDRKITRPAVAGFTLYISNVAQTVGTDYTLDEDTGIVTIPAAPSQNIVTWSGKFYVPVHFLEDTIDWDLVAPSQDPDARFLAGPSCMLQEIRE